MYKVAPKLMLALFLLAPNCLLAQSPEKLTLNDSIQLALSHNPSLHRMEAQIGIAQSKTKQALSGLLPTVILQGAATDGPAGAPAFGTLGGPSLNGAPTFGLQGMAADPLKKNYGVGVTFSQSLYDFGRTQNLVSARQSMESSARIDLILQKNWVRLQVIQNYLNVLRSDSLIVSAQENLKSRKTALHQAKALVEAGLRSGVDFKLTEANVADAEQILQKSNGDRETALASLYQVMGETNRRNLALQPESSLAAIKDWQKDVKESPDEGIRLALLHRPEIKGQSLQQKAASDLIKSATSEAKPRIDGIASVGVVNPSSIIANSKNYAVGLAVSLPLYTGGLTQSRIEEERQKLKSLEAINDELKQLIQAQVTRAHSDYFTALTQSDTAKKQLEAANASLDLASERYRLELGNIVELNEAQSVAVRARERVIATQYDLGISLAYYRWAIGADSESYSVKKL